MTAAFQPSLLEDLVKIIVQETQTLRSVLFAHKIHPNQVRSFALDLALIGLSIRTSAYLSPLCQTFRSTNYLITTIYDFSRAGHLVDAFCPKDPCKGLSLLIHSLRQRLKLFFKDVVHVYEPSSEQSFLVNVPLLLARYSPDAPEINVSSPWPFAYPTFVSTESAPEIIFTPPTKLFTLLQDLTNQVSNPARTATILLPQGLSAELMVPFAALLLEYPVAYCPPATVTSPFLSGVVLDVYEVCLELPATEGNGHRTSSSLNRRQPILKFSCPSDLSIASSGMLSPGSLMEELRSRFDARVAGKGLKVSVHHSSEILDRVAL